MTTDRYTRIREIFAANILDEASKRYARAGSKNKQLIELAKESGVGHATLKKWTTPTSNPHMPRLDGMEDVAQALKCELWELFKEPETPPE